MADQNFSPIAEQKKELRRILESLSQIPNNDSNSSVGQLVLYLNQLLRTRGITPPTSEVMIILQSTKPMLYHATRLSLTRSSHLVMLFEIKGDVQLAQQRFDVFLETL